MFRGIPVWNLVFIILYNILGAFLVWDVCSHYAILGTFDIAYSYVIFIMTLLCLDFYLWGCIKYPEQIIINSSGITYHERNFSFFNGFSITTYFYSWSDISKVSMKLGRDKHERYYLLLKDTNQQEIKISLKSIRCSVDDIFDAVRDCCPGRDMVDLASWRKEKKKECMGAIVVIVVIALMIIMYFVMN